MTMQLIQYWRARSKGRERRPAASPRGVRRAGALEDHRSYIQPRAVCTTGSEPRPPLAVIRSRSLADRCRCPSYLQLIVGAAQSPRERTELRREYDRTIAQELADGNAKRNAALASEHGINADINATLGRW